MIILNEKEYAEECLKNRDIISNPFQTLQILAKYFYHIKGFRKKKITQLLMEYLDECYPAYADHRLTWEETIDKLAKNAKRYSLHEINGVWITSKELEVIQQLNSAPLEKLAFTLLCLAKLGNLRNPKNSNWVNNDAKEIFTLARISCTVTERYENLGMLGSLGYLEFPKRLENLSVRVTYDYPESEKILFISDFRELGYEYLYYLGGNFTRCGECGRLFRNSDPNNQYCKECVGYKTVICVDCGKEFRVRMMNNQTTRCDDCYQEYRRKYKTQKELERYYKNKENVE